MPGCYPTAVSLALAPGLVAGVVLPDDITVVAASGTSGAGKALKAHLLGAEVMGAMSPYGVGGVHRHTPEIEQNLTAAGAGDVTVSFTPTLAPMPRGILATCTAKVAPGTTAAAVRDAWTSAYADEPFVHLLPEGRWPSTGSVLGSNCVHLQVVLDERVGRVVVVAAVDNLTKGTAGAAVQCLNLALGLPETTGLPVGRSRTVSAMPRHLMEHPEDVAIVRLPGGEEPQFDWTAGPFASLTRTPDETSIVCLAAAVPAGVAHRGAVQGRRGRRAAGVRRRRRLRRDPAPARRRRHLGPRVLDLRHRLGPRARRATPTPPRRPGAAPGCSSPPPR